MAVWTAPVNKADGDQVTEAEWDAYFGVNGNLQYLKDAIDAIATAPVAFSAGAVGAPSIYMAGDTTTGFYRPAANQIGVAVSGVRAALLTSTGFTIDQNLILSAASAKIIPGATSLLFRNNADNATLVTILNTGAVGIGVSPSSLFHIEQDTDGIKFRISRVSQNRALVAGASFGSAVNGLNAGHQFIAVSGDLRIGLFETGLGGGGGAGAFAISAGGTSRFLISSTGVVSVGGKFYPVEDDGVIQSACAIYAGTGAPNDANGANGDIYFRSDGAALTTTYQRRAGVWTGLL